MSMHKAKGPVTHDLLVHKYCTSAFYQFHFIVCATSVMDYNWT